MVIEVHNGGNVVYGNLEAQLIEALEQWLHVLVLGSPFEEIADCHFGSEVLRVDHAQVGERTALLLRGGCAALELLLHQLDIIILLHLHRSITSFEIGER